MINRRPRHLGMVILVVVTSAFTGCSGRNAVSLDKLQPWKEKPERPVSNIICMWEASRGRDMYGSPARGVAGEITFFTPNSKLPVKVDGDVEIYVFDNQGTPEEQTKPIHKFRFDSKSWNRHFIESGSVGPSYNVFVPYTRKVVHQVEVSMSVRFMPKNGRQPVVSSIDRVVLPGPLRASDANPAISIVSRQEGGKKTNVTTLNQHGIQNTQPAGRSHRTLMGNEPIQRSRNLLEPRNEQPDLDRREPIRQMSGIRENRSSFNSPSAQRQHQRAEALLDRDPELRRLMNDYRQRTGHRGFDQQDNGREEAGVTASRGFRLGGTSPDRRTSFRDRSFDRKENRTDLRDNSQRQFSGLNDPPDRDPFVAAHSNRREDGFDDPGNRHPLTTAGFSTRQPVPRENDRRQPRTHYSIQQESHPLGGAFNQPDDGYNRPTFSATGQPRRDNFNQPTASDLLNGSTGSANWQRNDAGYRPVVDERRAWAHE